MQIQRTPRFRPPMLLAVFAVAIAGLTACEGVDTPSAPEDRSPTSADLSTNDAEMRRGLATFRQATARYHRVEAALEDGFVPLLECQENPAGAGALGIPFARLDRFDAEIDLSEPEILFYEPQPNGRLRLVGGEPVVPIDLWTGSEPPSLFGREFHHNVEHGLFGLHMWIWRHNPDGVFAFWHPDVTCDFAE